VKGVEMKLKNRLRVLRAEKEISQKDLADEVGLSRQTVNSIERGKFNPSIITALKIADYFAVRVDEVFQLEEDE
jgi:putative transcriptional regulator